MKWTHKDLIDLKGKTAIVTGANSGIGYYKAYYLAKQNAHVIIAVRTISKGKDAADKILKDFPYASIDVLELDLNDFESIKGFSTKFHSKYTKLDYLFNNAGIMTTPYQPTKQGLESQIGVNHFGHYLLTSLLFDVLKNTKNARIINTASIAHRFGDIETSTFMYKEGAKYNKSKAYAQSKIANLLFTKKLARLIEEHNLDITVLASHPGISKTDLGRYIRGNPVANFLMWAMGFARQHASKGALPALLAATDQNVVAGTFYGPRGLYNTKGYPKVHKSNKKSNDPKRQDLLWEESVRITETDFDFTS